MEEPKTKFYFLLIIWKIFTAMDRKLWWCKAFYKNEGNGKPDSTKVKVLESGYEMTEEVIKAIRGRNQELKNDVLQEQKYMLKIKIVYESNFKS